MLELACRRTTKRNAGDAFLGEMSRGHSRKKTVQALDALIGTARQTAVSRTHYKVTDLCATLSDSKYVS